MFARDTYQNVYNNPKNTKYNITVVAFDDSNKVIDNKLIQVKDGVITDTGEANLDLATGSSITVGHLEFYVNKIKQAKTVNFYLANRLLSFSEDNQIVQGSNHVKLGILNVDPKEPHHNIMLKVKDNDPKVHITRPADGNCEVYYNHNCDIEYTVDNASSVEQQNNQALTPFAITADGTSIGAPSPQLQIFSCGTEASVSFVKPKDVFDQDGSYTTSLVYCPASQEHTINFTELKTSYLELPTTDHHDANPAIIKNVKFHIKGFEPDSLSQANRLQDDSMNDITAQVMLDDDTSHEDSLTLSLKKPQIEFARDVSVSAGGRVSFGLKVSGHVLDSISIDKSGFVLPAGMTEKDITITGEESISQEGEYNDLSISPKKTLTPGIYDIGFTADGPNKAYQTLGVLHLTVKPASNIEYAPKSVNFLTKSTTNRYTKSFYLVLSSKTREEETVYLSGKADSIYFLLDPKDKKSEQKLCTLGKDCQCKISSIDSKCVFIVTQQYLYLGVKNPIVINSKDGGSIGQVDKIASTKDVNQMTLETLFNTTKQPGLTLDSVSIFNDDLPSAAGDSDAVVTDGLAAVINGSAKSGHNIDTINNFTGQTYIGNDSKTLVGEWVAHYHYTSNKNPIKIDCHFVGLTSAPDYKIDSVTCNDPGTFIDIPVTFNNKSGSNSHTLTFI